jgi:hypothetical protein
MNYVVIYHPVIKSIVPHDIKATESFIHVIGDFVGKFIMAWYISHEVFIETLCMILDMVKDQRANWVGFMLF